MIEQVLSVEAEIAELEKKLAEKRAALKRQKAEGQIEKMPHEKEILRETLKEKIAAVPEPTGSSSGQPAQPVLPPPAETPSYLSEELKPKIQELINLAFEKSLDEAIKTAKATQNPALIDAFHDALVDEMYNHLIERGKIRSIE